MAEGKIFVFMIPSALSKRKLTLESRGSDFHTSHSKLIAPTARSWASEQFTGWITGIDNGLAWFFLKLAIRSIVDNLKIGRFSRSTATDGRSAFESLWISCIVPIAVSTAFTTGRGLVAKGGKVVDMVSRDVGAGGSLDLKGTAQDQEKSKHDE